jgi:hypothetical protein
MAKIPLEKTIEGTYRFAFTNILSVFGVMWLPTLIFFALLGGAIYLALPDLVNLFPPDFGKEAHSPDEARERVQHLLPLVFAFMRIAWLASLIGLVLRAMVAVGVLEKALGRRQGPVFVYFSLGAPVWRMVGALFLAGLIIFASVFASVIVGAIVFWAATQYAGGVAGLVKFVTVCAAFAWNIYMAVRLMFFLPAVVVAEERIGFGRAWQLGGGNFWRIILVVLAVFLPVGIAAGIISNILFGSFFWNDIHTAILAHREMTPDEVFATVWRNLQHMWPFLLVFEILYITLLTGLGLGAVANAYKGVTEAPA